MSTPNVIGKYFHLIETQLMKVNVSRPWMLVSKTLLEAESKLQKTDFKSLTKTLKFSKSRVSKLLTIAKSKRLDTFSIKLERVDAYTTLYEIATLSDPDFVMFEAKYLSSTDAKMIERADVSMMKSTTATPTSALLTFVTIKLDPNNVPAPFAKTLIDAVNTLQSIAPKNAIVTTSSYKKYVKSRASFKPIAVPSSSKSSIVKIPQPTFYAPAPAEAA